MVRLHTQRLLWDNVTDKNGVFTDMALAQRQKIVFIVSGLFLTLLVTGILCTAMVFATNPQKLGPAGVTFWFIGVFLFAGSVLSLLGFAWKMRKVKNREKPMWSINEALRTGFLLSFAGVVLLALASLKSLSWRDVILFVLTIIIVEFYFRTRRAKG
ncbi:hypothetical protein HYX70_03535 [Candidatus Saccharibacteria bacterium]|nr:hypothetical protein [Candidatus Saccharibacteria bacterium]